MGSRDGGGGGSGRDATSFLYIRKYLIPMTHPILSSSIDYFLTYSTRASFEFGVQSRNTEFNVNTSRREVVFLPLSLSSILDLHAIVESHYQLYQSCIKT